MLNILDIQPPLRLDIYAHESMRPQVIQVREFNAVAAEKFCKEFQEAIQRRQPIIPIHIDTYGGEVYSLQSMIGVIQTSPVPVATFTQSKAMSCGSMLLAFGTKGYRYMSPRSILMVHEVSGGAGGKVHEVRVDSDETIRLNNEIFQEMGLHCGWHKDYFLAQIHTKSHADWYVKPEEAKKRKIVDHIGIPKLVTRVTAVTTLEF